MIRLGVNIDHVATIRNARGSKHPEPLKAAKIAIKAGADSITIHLREDRRHIKVSDFLDIVKQKKILLNLEMAIDQKILRLVTKNKPNYICIVPEKRKEITTEGGLNVKKNYVKLKKIIPKLKKLKIRTSLFVNPKINDIKLCKNLKVDCIELHTGKISELIKSNKDYKKELIKIIKCAKLANFFDLEVHAGHGMDYKTSKILSKIKYIKEFNIGHFIVGESLFYGFTKTIKKFKRIINKR
jgi:pyridoxine 5-phosphate synthase